MARPLRIEFEGAVYHLCARGNERQRVFRTEQHGAFISSSCWNAPPRGIKSVLVFVLIIKSGTN